MLKNNLPQKKSLARAATRSLLNSLDATPFHERVKRVTQVPSDNEKAKISIIQ